MIDRAKLLVTTLELLVAQDEAEQGLHKLMVLRQGGALIPGGQGERELATLLRSISQKWADIADVVSPQEGVMESKEEWTSRMNRLMGNKEA